MQPKQVRSYLMKRMDFDTSFDSFHVNIQSMGGKSLCDGNYEIGRLFTLAFTITPSSLHIKSALELIWFAGFFQIVWRDNTHRRSTSEALVSSRACSYLKQFPTGPALRGGEKKDTIPATTNHQGMNHLRQSPQLWLKTHRLQILSPTAQSLHDLHVQRVQMLLFDERLLQIHVWS